MYRLMPDTFKNLKEYDTRYSIKKRNKKALPYLKLVDEYAMHRQVRKQSGKAAASGKGTHKKGVDLNPVTESEKETD